MGDLKWVKAKWETFRGPVAVQWRIEGAAFHMTLDLPPGITASVHLPGRAAAEAASGHHEYSEPVPR